MSTKFIIKVRIAVRKVRRKNLEIKITELVDYLQISRTTLYNFSDFDEKTIENFKNLFKLLLQD